MMIRNNVLAHQDEMIEALVQMIKIPSVLDETQGGPPFGKSIDEALDAVLSLCERLGFNIYKDPDGYYGYAEYGSGETLIGVLGHIDVVPEGDASNWKHAPFNGEVHGGKVYGRGAIDDKGPLIAAIYGIKAVMDSGKVFNKRVRIIIGTDEENRWRGICKYVSKEALPDMGFTPDSSFPVVFAEKGLLQFKLKSNKRSELSVKGGHAFNAVPESVVYKGSDLVKLERQLKKMGFDHEFDQDEICVIGKSAHSAKPQQGINAILRMVAALKSIEISSPVLDFIADKIGFTHTGELIFGSCYDVPSGELTLSVNHIDLSEYGETIGIDCRIPVTVDRKFIEDGIKRVAEKYGLIYECVDAMDALFLSKEDVMIQTLIDVYEEETGLDGEPIATGGATYARSMKNIVAFGPLFPGQEKVAHQPDEYIEVSVMVKCAQIYGKAIEKLLDVNDTKS